METTRARRQLIDDCKARGMTVRESSNAVRISTGKTYKSVGITMWDDGSATRNDIDFGYATAIRTIKAMRQVLSL